jgi:hypothetical protein
MAIEFNCAACGQALFSQAIYAGMEVSCPVCKARSTIPKPLVENVPPAASQLVADPYLVDMETYKESIPAPSPAPVRDAAPAPEVAPPGELP